MKKFNTELRHYGWTAKSDDAVGFLFAGQPYIETRKASHQAMSDFLNIAGEAHHMWLEKLEKLNGFYALVKQEGNNLVAAVDHIRSMPLFYGLHGGKLYLSDNAEWVRRRVEDQEMDVVARAEFQLTGYVTGADTLFPNVKQLQAGEVLFASEKEGTLSVSCERYYHFHHIEPARYDREVLLNELDQVALRFTEKLVDYAAGRQIVLPLSGGYDSRLIATLLRRVGYTNVLAFTYGVRGNKESQFSKRVADALGFRWHFVEYTGERWCDGWQSEARWQHQMWASGWSSVPHMQDWLAVKLLKDESVVEHDCVFVPGHTGDFISGGHIPEGAEANRAADAGQFTDAILQKHYSLAPLTEVDADARCSWKERIQEVIGFPTVVDGQGFADAAEQWEWQERQAKYICNSVRVYEFYGFDWWLPLWDKDFVRFWERVPLTVRKGRGWYIAYVSSLFNRYGASLASVELRNASDYSSLRAIKLIAKTMHIESLLNKLYVRIFPSGKGPASLLWRSRYPALETDELLRKGYQPVGINAHNVLKDTDRWLRSGGL